MSACRQVSVISVTYRPVVLALNSFFVLEYVRLSVGLVRGSQPTLLRNDPTPDRDTQLPRAAALIISSLGFIHDLRAGMPEPDTDRARMQNGDAL